MDSTFYESLLNSVLPQLGLSTIFVLITLRIYNDSEKKIKDKDEYIKALTATLQDLYVRNTEIMAQLKDTMNANLKATETNTEALRSLERSTRQ